MPRNWRSKPRPVTGSWKETRLLINLAIALSHQSNEIRKNTSNQTNFSLHHTLPLAPIRGVRLGEAGGARNQAWKACRDDSIDFIVLRQNGGRCYGNPPGISDRFEEFFKECVGALSVATSLLQFACNRNLSIFLSRFVSGCWGSLLKCMSFVMLCSLLNFC